MKEKEQQMEFKKYLNAYKVDFVFIVIGIILGLGVNQIIVYYYDWSSKKEFKEQIFQALEKRKQKEINMIHGLENEIIKIKNSKQKDEIQIFYINSFSNMG